MKIKELMSILSKFNQESIIYSDLGDSLDSPWNYSVDVFDVSLVEKRVDPELKKVAGRPCKETSNCELGVIIYVKKNNR